MAASTRDVGGGPATGLADSFVSQLQGLLNSGGTGVAGSPNPGGATTGIMGILSQLLQPGGGQAGGAISTLINQQQTRDVNALRARFGASGGSAFGTPGATAEAQYRAEAAPQFMNALTGLQLQAIGPLLSAITGLSGKGISQRQTIQEQDPLTTAIGAIGAIAPSLAKKGAGVIAAPDVDFTGSIPTSVNPNTGQATFAPPASSSRLPSNLSSVKGLLGPGING